MDVKKVKTQNDIDYIIEKDCKQIAKLVNARFEVCREYIKGKILSCIKEILTPLPPHFVWCRGRCPYDSSGELKEDGLVSLDQTISHFLENEYTGYSEATFISGFGLHWCSWGDALSDETREIGRLIMDQAIIQYLSEKLGRIVTDEEISSADTDPVYDLCLASDFFSYEPAIQFVGVEDVSLSMLMKEPDKNYMEEA